MSDSLLLHDSSSTTLAIFSARFGLFAFRRKLTASNNYRGNAASSNDKNSSISTKFDGAARSRWKSTPGSHFMLLSLPSVIFVGCYALVIYENI